jgi:hypothetical protein
MKTIMRGLDVSGSRILKLILYKYDGMAWTDLFCSRQGKGAARCYTNIGFYDYKMGKFS